MSTTDRYSVPFFYQGNLATKLSPLDGTGDGSEQIVEGHIKAQFVKTFGAEKDN